MVLMQDAPECIEDSMLESMQEGMQDEFECGIPERIGNITMSVRTSRRTPENQEKWDRRSEVLAAWLLAQWEREQLRRIAENN